LFNFIDPDDPDPATADDEETRSIPDILPTASQGPGRGRGRGRGRGVRTRGGRGRGRGQAATLAPSRTSDTRRNRRSTQTSEYDYYPIGSRNGGWQSQRDFMDSDSDDFEYSLR